MLLDARTVRDRSVLNSQICVVGGGVAGITLAREWIGRGFKVLMIESGGLEAGLDTRGLDAGENIGFPYFPLESARARGLAGSSALWHVELEDGSAGVRMRPMDTIDFEARDWVPHSGWPFPASHLDEYYARAQGICELGEPTFAAGDWDDPELRPRLEFEGDDVQSMVYKICRRDRFTRDFRRDVIEAENVTVCLNGTIVGIDCDSTGTVVDQVRVATLQGNRFRVTANAFVLAAGGIETPRLMLQANRRQPTGMGNEHGLVGRYFMEHLHFWSGVLVPDDPGLVERLVFYRDVSTVRGVGILGKLALTETALRRERLLNQNIQLIPTHLPDPFEFPRLRGRAVESLKSILLGEGLGRRGRRLFDVAGGWKAFARAGMKRIRHALGGLPERLVLVFANMTEQAPNPASRVLLGSDRDAFGLRRVRLDWRISEQDIESVVRTQQIVGRAFERSGLGRFHQEQRDCIAPRSLRGFDDPRGTHGGYHHMGTTRMHDDPKQGVVDAHCRVHGMHNLFIAGPSVFPTGGYANPTLSIMALALKLAGHLERALSDGGLPESRSYSRFEDRVAKHG